MDQQALDQEFVLTPVTSETKWGEDAPKGARAAFARIIKEGANVRRWPRPRVQKTTFLMIANGNVAGHQLSLLKRPRHVRLILTARDSSGSSTARLAAILLAAEDAVGAVLAEESRALLRKAVPTHPGGGPRNPIEDRSNSSLIRRHPEPQHFHRKH